jgi:hypothetical protein
MKKSVTVFIIFIMMQFRLIAMVQNQDLKEFCCAYIEKSIKILSQHIDDYIRHYLDFQIVGDLKSNLSKMELNLSVVCAVAQSYHLQEPRHTVC